MDLLPEKESKESMRHRFRSMKPLIIDMDHTLAEDPYGADYGILENGLVYYVRCNSKPRMRAALALAVKVGSVLEEEDERGVAHIVEHLAFSATKNYTNHDIVKFLESIGAEFGACQNAYTSTDETVFELFVPIDKPHLLSQSISILAEFSCEVRVSKEDLNKERGAVMDELRGNRNAHGRMQDSHWMMMMEGSKYADRIPIGLEKVICNVSTETVKGFYNKWYHLNRMAVVAVGDFSDTQSVVELVKTHFGPKLSSHGPPEIPLFSVPFHEETRFSCSVEAEAAGSEVLISYKKELKKLQTVKDYRDFLAESMFLCALNQRFFKISRGKDPPYFSCALSSEILSQSTEAYIIISSCKEKGTLIALESMLLEVARVRIHGFSERETSIAKDLLLSDTESLYLQREQLQSSNLRDEYIRHFFGTDIVPGIEYEAQLRKTILPFITSSELSRCSEKMRTSCSCVVRSVEHKAVETVEGLKMIAEKVNFMEYEKSIPPWVEEHIPEQIVSKIPIPSEVESEFQCTNIGAAEIIMSNGMRVCYKCTDFLDDQVVFKGFSYGGLSELPESEFFSCSMGSVIAGEIGIFGYKPWVLKDILAGKRAEVGVKIVPYGRMFFGDCSPSDLETALQLVYQLFMTEVKPREDEVKIVMQMTEESIRAQERDPYTVFLNRVREINYGTSYFFRDVKMKDLNKVDPFKACEYFSNCFRDPSTFVVVIVGNIDPDTARPLLLRYLGGIPKPSQSMFSPDRDNLKGIPFTFPSAVTREVVCSTMHEAQCSVQLCFPLELKNESVMEDIQYVGFLSRLIETKIIHVLRFKHGLIYSVGVSIFLGGNKPSRVDDIRGDMSVMFSCDPAISSSMVDLALHEIRHLQENGFSVADVSAVLEIEQRAHENGMQENSYWVEKIIHSYRSRIYSGDVDSSFQMQEEGRRRVREELTPYSAQGALQRVFPNPCTNQYTCVVLIPSPPSLLASLLPSIFKTHICNHAKIWAAIGGLMVIAIGLRRSLRKS